MGVRGERRATRLALRRRRLVEIPRQLEAAEEKAFETAKKLETRGQADRAAFVFEASRIAFQARAKVLAMDTASPGLDEALDAAQNVLNDLRQLT